MIKITLPSHHLKLCNFNEDFENGFFCIFYNIEIHSENFYFTIEGMWILRDFILKFFIIFLIYIYFKF